MCLLNSKVATREEEEEEGDSTNILKIICQFVKSSIKSLSQCCVT